MTIYNGWTQEISREQREANRRQALAAIEIDRLAALDEVAQRQRDELQAMWEEIQEARSRKASAIVIVEEV